MTSAIYNVHRRRGATMLQPADFLSSSARPVQHVDGAVLLDLMGGWLKLRRQ